MNGLATTATRPSYQPENFELLFEAEHRHFWFRARNHCIASAIRLIGNRDSIQDIIEHGCGNGFVLAELQRLFPHARITGADMFAEGLKLARRRFCGRLEQIDLLECKYREAFDLIGLFDVLEHLDDDLQVLRALRQQLRPGGCLLLTVPAHMALWSDFDRIAGHRRRYTRPQLIAKLSEAGFHVEYCTGFMLVLFPIMWLRRRLAWRKATGESVQTKNDLKVPRLLNFMLEFVLRPEGWWIQRGRRLPGGTSLLALAVRGPHP